MANGSERRSGPRLALDANAIIRFDSIQSGIQSRILNASQNGLLLAMPEPRPVGTRIHITVQIEDPVYEINVSGYVVHVTPKSHPHPSLSTHVGIFLTDSGADWAALCRRLARLAQL